MADNAEEYYRKQYDPIDGKWHIIGELGRGSTGIVLELARRDFKGMNAALKIIPIPSSEAAYDKYRNENYDLDDDGVKAYFYGFVEDFVQKFEVMSKLRGNSYIVSCEDYDVKEHKNAIGWDILLRMELLTPLNKYFVKNRPEERDIIKLGIDVLNALEVCAQYSIVHGDIKPDNIFVTDRGGFKLGGLESAYIGEGPAGALSDRGRHTYMAPEVCRGESFDQRADIYSVGMVMYKNLNGNMEPFSNGRSRGDVEEAMVRRLGGEALPKPKNGSDELVRIVLKAVSFDREDRYASPGLMREELEHILTMLDSDAVLEKSGVQQEAKLNAPLAIDRERINKRRNMLMEEIAEKNGALIKKEDDQNDMVAELPYDENDDEDNDDDENVVVEEIPEKRKSLNGRLIIIGAAAALIAIGAAAALAARKSSEEETYIEATEATTEVVVVEEETVAEEAETVVWETEITEPENTPAEQSGNDSEQSGTRRQNRRTPNNGRVSTPNEQPVPVPEPAPQDEDDGGAPVIADEPMHE